MLRHFARPVPLFVALACCTFIPVALVLERTVPIPTGTWDDDAARSAVAPVSWFLHAAAGAVFGIIGPLQFALAQRRRFGWLHRLAGRVFLVAGVVLGLAALSLFARIVPQDTVLLLGARVVFAMALLCALAATLAAIHARDIPRHRVWAMRAYAIGMGSGTVAPVLFPIYVVTGQAPVGLLSDVVVVSWWTLNIALAEWIIHRSLPSNRRASA